MAIILLGHYRFTTRYPEPDVPVNLDVSMFDLTSSGDGTPAMYAAYRLSNFNVNPNDPNNPDGEFWAFASSKPFVEEQGAATPLPGAILLMGTVLAGGAGFGAWRRRKQSKS